MSPHSSRRPLALAIHGGAGVIERGSLAPEVETAIHAELARALDVGHAILATGGSALDAVEAADRADQPYAAVCLDLGMPGLDGVQTAQALRADTQGVDLLVQLSRYRGNTNSRVSVTMLAHLRNTKRRYEDVAKEFLGILYEKNLKK